MGKQKELVVKEIFKSIQGEGPYSGRRAIFIRLAGCNLKCSFCDTDHEGGESLSVSEIMFRITKEAGGKFPSLIVITGGEPFLQDFSDLVKKLHLKPTVNIIQIETNGTIYQPAFPYHLTKIICSPKPDTVISNLIKQHITAWKILVRHGDKLAPQGEEIPKRPKGVPINNIYIQPMDEKDPALNKKNMDWAVDLCLTHGYRLSLQLQKILKIM